MVATILNSPAWHYDVHSKPGKDPNMVATRGTNAEFVTDNEQISPEVLTPSEWEEIIASAVDQLTTGYLRGFRPLNHLIVQNDGIMGGTHIKDVVKTAVIHGGLPAGMKTNSVFYYCGMIIPRPASDEWPAQNGQKLLFRDSWLLFARNKQFYVLNVTWKLIERWEESNTRHPAERSWTAQKIELGQTDLAVLISQHPERGIGAMVLKNLFRAQSDTAHELHEQYRHAHQAQLVLQGYLKRLGAFQAGPLRF